MAWYDTKSTGSTITASEWNSMVTVIRQLPHTLYDNNDIATLTLNQTVIVGDTTAGAITLTLPEASTCLGKVYIAFLETDGGTNMNIDCASGDDFDGGGSDAAQFNDAGDYFIIVAVSNNRWLVLVESGVGYP